MPDPTVEAQVNAKLRELAHAIAHLADPDPPPPPPVPAVPYPVQELQELVAEWDGYAEDLRNGAEAGISGAEVASGLAGELYDLLVRHTPSLTRLAPAPAERADA